MKISGQGNQNFFQILEKRQKYGILEEIMGIITQNIFWEGQLWKRKSKGTDISINW